jgi:hypothetical protein
MVGGIIFRSLAVWCVWSLACKRARIYAGGSRLHMAEKDKLPHLNFVTPIPFLQSIIRIGGSLPLSLSKLVVGIFLSSSKKKSITLNPSRATSLCYSLAQLELRLFLRLPSKFRMPPTRSSSIPPLVPVLICGILALIVDLALSRRNQVT